MRKIILIALLTVFVLACSHALNYKTFQYNNANYSLVIKTRLGTSVSLVCQRDSNSSDNFVEFKEKHITNFSDINGPFEEISKCELDKQRGVIIIIYTGRHKGKNGGSTDEIDLKSF